MRKNLLENIFFFLFLFSYLAFGLKIVLFDKNFVDPSLLNYQNPIPISFLLQIFGLNAFVLKFTNLVIIILMFLLMKKISMEIIGEKAGLYSTLFFMSSFGFIWRLFTYIFIAQILSIIVLMILTKQMNRNRKLVVLGLGILGSLFHRLFIFMFALYISIRSIFDHKWKYIALLFITSSSILFYFANISTSILPFNQRYDFFDLKFDMDRVYFLVNEIGVLGLVGFLLGSIKILNEKKKLIWMVSFTAVMIIIQILNQYSGLRILWEFSFILAMIIGIALEEIDKSKLAKTLIFSLFFVNWYNLNIINLWNSNYPQPITCPDGSIYYPEECPGSCVSPINNLTILTGQSQCGFCKNEQSECYFCNNGNLSYSHINCS